jgi:hypothetical protein
LLADSSCFLSGAGARSLTLELETIHNAASLILFVWPKLRDLRVSAAEIQRQPIKS